MLYVVVLAVILAINGVNCRDPEADFRRLPKLFHLDDFEQCLERNDGLYCAGIFEIYSDYDDNPLYDLIKKKSGDVYSYNRTLLHRGYCLPTRCPSDEQNATARFERCVDAWARSHSLRTRLQTLHYCRAHGQPPQRNTDDLPHTVFLYVVLVLLFMNVFGTVYDLFIGPRGKKNRFLMMFSLRINWTRLIAVQDAQEPSMRGLQALNGIKALLLTGAVYAHVGIILTAAWVNNSLHLEKEMLMAASTLGSLTTTTQLFVLMSHFLTTYNLLLLAKQTKVGFNRIPYLFLKRYLRLLPVYIMVNAFSATWWTSMGDGPMWPIMVEAESKICREKFWVQAFFLQNIFQRNRICNVQTWVLAVDLQLYIPSLVLIILLLRRQRQAITILSGLIVGATALTGFVVYTRNYIPMFYLMTPENFRLMFPTERTFIEFFIQPINCLVVMLFGILLGFLYFNYLEKKMRADSKSEKKVKNPSILSIVIHNFWVPIVITYACIVARLKVIKDPLFTTFMAMFERVLNASLFSVYVYTSAYLKTPFTAMFRSNAFRLISRVSLSISMLHWCVNKTLVANRYLLVDFSTGVMLLDTIGVSVISFVLAIPITLLIEYPMTKVTDKFLTYIF